LPKGSLTGYSALIPLTPARWKGSGTTILGNS
jgi:hypothetical protein